VRAGAHRGSQEVVEGLVPRLHDDVARCSIHEDVHHLGDEVLLAGREAGHQYHLLQRSDRGLPHPLDAQGGAGARQLAHLAKSARTQQSAGFGWGKGKLAELRAREGSCQTRSDAFVEKEKSAG
jgi:hypothetical protein